MPDCACLLFLNLLSLILAKNNLSQKAFNKTSEKEFLSNDVWSVDFSGDDVVSSNFRRDEKKRRTFFWGSQSTIVCITLIEAVQKRTRRNIFRKFFDIFRISRHLKQLIEVEFTCYKVGILLMRRENFLVWEDRKNDEILYPLYVTSQVVFSLMKLWQLAVDFPKFAGFLITDLNK